MASLTIESDTGKEIEISYEGSLEDAFRAALLHPDIAPDLEREVDSVETDIRETVSFGPDADETSDLGAIIASLIDGSQTLESTRERVYRDTLEREIEAIQEWDGVWAGTNVSWIVNVFEDDDLIEDEDEFGLDRYETMSVLQEVIQKKLEERFKKEPATLSFAPNLRVTLAFLLGYPKGATPEDYPIEAASRIHSNLPIIASEALAPLFETLNVDKDAFCDWMGTEMDRDPRDAGVVAYSLAGASPDQIDRRQQFAEEQASAWRTMEVATDKDAGQLIDNQSLFHIIEEASYGGAPVVIFRPRVGQFLDALAQNDKVISLHPAERGTCGLVGIDDLHNAGHLESLKHPVTLDLSKGAFYNSDRIDDYLDNCYGFSGGVLDVEVQAGPAPKVELEAAAPAPGF